MSKPLAAEPDLVDVRDMVVVHTALLREFRLAPRLVRDTADGDARRAATLAGHLRLVLDLLDHHHAGEDRLLWPKLQARAPESLPHLTLMSTQHEQIHIAIEAARAGLPGWSNTPTVGLREALAEHLDRLHSRLADHLDAEERHLLPLAAVHLTTAEWHEIGETAVKAIPKRQLPVVFGLIVYEGDPAVTATMLNAAPAPVRLFMPHVARRAYARYARRIHRTSRP